MLSVRISNDLMFLSRFNLESLCLLFCLQIPLSPSESPEYSDAPESLSPPTERARPSTTTTRSSRSRASEEAKTVSHPTNTPALKKRSRFARLLIDSF